MSAMRHLWCMALAVPEVTRHAQHKRIQPSAREGSVVATVTATQQQVAQLKGELRMETSTSLKARTEQRQVQDVGRRAERDAVRAVSATVRAFEQRYWESLPPEHRNRRWGEWGEQGLTSIDDVLERRSLRGPQRPAATIMMSYEEANVFVDALLSSHARRYVEWGSGGSTELVSWLMLSKQVADPSFKAFSIESSVEWTRVLQNRSTLIEQAAHSGRLTFLHGDVGPTGALGFPKRHPDLPTALQFVSPAQSESLPRKIDIALVDGRFRVACAYSAALHLAPDGTLFFHDFGPPMMSSRRHEYEALLREGHFDLVGLNRSLARLKLRHDLPLDPAVADQLRQRRDYWAARSAA